MPNANPYGGSFAIPDQLHVDWISFDGDLVTIHASTEGPAAECPLCERAFQRALQSSLLEAFARLLDRGSGTLQHLGDLSDAERLCLRVFAHVDFEQDAGSVQLTRRGGARSSATARDRCGGCKDEGFILSHESKLDPLPSLPHFRVVPRSS